MVRAASSLPTNVRDPFPRAKPRRASRARFKPFHVFEPLLCLCVGLPPCPCWLRWPWRVLRLCGCCRLCCLSLCCLCVCCLCWLCNLVLSGGGCLRLPGLLSRRKPHHHAHTRGQSVGDFHLHLGWECTSLLGGRFWMIERQHGARRCSIRHHHLEELCCVVRATVLCVLRRTSVRCRDSGCCCGACGGRVVGGPSRALLRRRCCRRRP